MSSKTRTAAGMALATVIGLSFVAAQDVPPLSRSRQVEAAKAFVVEVLGANRKGLPNTSVSLTDLDRDRGTKSGITDSNGCVRFEDVPDGKYRVNISGPGIKDPASVGFVAPGAHWWQFWLLVKDGKTVELRSTPCESCGGPLNASAPLVDTTTSPLESQIPLPPDSSPSAVPSSAQHRNPLARFSSGIGHKLGL